MPDVLPRHAGPISLNAEQLAKLRSELDIVQGNMKVFCEMLTELTPCKEHPQDLELLQVRFSSLVIKKAKGMCYRQKVYGIYSLLHP